MQILTPKKLIKIIVPLFISGAFTALVLSLIKEHVQYDGMFNDISAWSAFFSVFGIVYAIVAGFLLVTVLTKYSDLSQVIENELNAIETVRDFLIYLNDTNKERKNNIRKALSNYTYSLLNKEWLEMSVPRQPMDSDTSDELYEIMRKSKEITVNADSDSVVFTAIIENISDITKLRTRRISLANEKLPPRLKILMVFMSIVLVAAFMMLAVQNMYVHIAIVVSLTVAIHLLYMIIEDLDHPFYGIWNINRMPLDELVTRFSKEQ
ncbi:DUF4239 domain-containing protein [Thalassotalea sp. LPB0316]|uniref:bestrophin-like domain n=1 Tax=Thalassotalea sp. LPB0316 TaxID=2769490 RepID=UPI001867E69C|nr:DUF4239 domain-containing protein [Thalassotalea sp. LPB0316]QOL24695.1 DUF4239 domain-containing protein [Thalassotalea sp. LPB0316]